MESKLDLLLEMSTRLPSAARLLSGVDHLANLSVVATGAAVALTIVALLHPAGGAILGRAWTPRLFVAFVALCGLRRVDDVVAFYREPAAWLSAFDVAMDLSLCLVSIALATRLPAVVRYVRGLPTRERYLEDLESLDRERSEQARFVAELADRDREIREKVLDLERQIATTCWLSENGAILRQLGQVLTGIKERQGGG